MPDEVQRPPIAEIASAGRGAKQKSGILPPEILELIHVHRNEGPQGEQLAVKRIGPDVGHGLVKVNQSIVLIRPLRRPVVSERKIIESWRDGDRKIFIARDFPDVRSIGSYLNRSHVSQPER